MKGFGLFVVAVALVLAVGWVVNLYKFTQCDFESPYKCEAIHGASIFLAPAGGVVGWMDFGE